MGDYLVAATRAALPVPRSRRLQLGVRSRSAPTADPDAAVVARSETGGFGHLWSELELAVREQLPVVVVLLDDGILGFQRHVELV